MKNKTVIGSVFVIIFAVVVTVLFFLTRNQSQQNNEATSSTQSKQNSNQSKQSSSSNQRKEDRDMTTIKLSVKGREMTVKLANNEATKALVKRLQDKSITLNLNEYGGFEQVGDLGFSLPTSDRQVTTKPGDIVLYQGDEISIFYGSNSWRYTPLGKIENIDNSELKDIFGTNSVTVELSH